jgi:hypothetical protein
MKANYGTFVIANGGTTSNEISLRYIKSLGIVAPATLPETVTVQVKPHNDANFRALSSGGSDVTVGAGKAIALEFLPFEKIRLVSGVNAAAERTFQVSAIEDTGR